MLSRLVRAIVRLSCLTRVSYSCLPDNYLEDLTFHLICHSFLGRLQFHNPLSSCQYSTTHTINYPSIMSDSKGEPSTKSNPLCLRKTCPRLLRPSPAQLRLQTTGLSNLRSQRCPCIQAAKAAVREREERGKAATAPLPDSNDDQEESCQDEADQEEVDQDDNSATHSAVAFEDDNAEDIARERGKVSKKRLPSLQYPSMTLSRKRTSRN